LCQALHPLHDLMHTPMTRPTSLLLLALLALLTACDEDAPATAPDMDATPDQSGALDMTTSADMASPSDMPDADTSPDADMSETMDMPDAPDQGPAPCAAPPGAIFVAADGAPGAAGTEAAPLATLAEALGRAQAGDTVVVRAGRYAEVLDMTRSGADGAPITVRGHCGERPVLDGSALTARDGIVAAVRIEGQHHIIIEGFEIVGLRAQRASETPVGVWVTGAAHHITLRDNLIHDLRAHRDGANSGAHGIAVYGTTRQPAHDITIQSNTLHDMKLGWSEALVVNGNVRDFLIEDNDVHDVDNIAYDFIGFEPDICAACSQLDTLDGDDLNRARRGTIRGNSAARVSSATNPAYNGEKAAGCFYVDGGAELIIERNTATQCDIGIELGSEWAGKSTRAIIVRDNLLIAHDVAGIGTGGYDDGDGPGGGSAKDCAVIHNTIVDSSRDGWADTGLLLQNRNVNNRYQNNIIVATTGKNAITIAGSLNRDNTISHNLTRGPLDGLTPGPGWLTGDPAFISATDLHLAPASPAIDAGAALPAAITSGVDHDGKARDTKPDIGAFER
jgi:hypothetical protein